MRKHELVYALNAGGVDPDALTRVDLEKMRLAGEHPVSNLLPMVLGPMTLRPGSETLTTVATGTRQIRFLRSTSTSYILLMSANEMRISLDGVIQQVPSVATAIASGSWTDVSTSPATATGGATLSLSATTQATAKLRQTVSVASGDQGKVNILRVVVSAGPVTLRVGTTAGGSELVPDSTLDTGTHKIGFTPGAATVYVEIQAVDPVVRSVSQIQFESTLIGTGDFVLPTPWASSTALRTWQSIDVLFAGDGTVQQRRIVHRGALSWGIELYKPNDGPFVAGSSRISMTPAALRGNTTVTASEAVFQAGHVGAIVELTQTSKTVEETFTGADQVSDYVTIIGVDAGRKFFRTGVDTSFVGTIVLERSFDPGEPVSYTTFATFVDGAATFARTEVDDGLDNLTAHYRFRVSAYTSGSAAMTLEYESGTQIGRARITNRTSSTVVDVEVIVPFGTTNGTRSWRISDWSDVRGWPRVPVIHDGRLHWFRDDSDYASFVDDYENFDDGELGDSATFTRSVGSGGEDGVLWALSETRLLVGTASFEAAIAASELDEALTPTAYTVRKVSRRGCADVEAVAHDDGVFYVQRSGKKLYEISVPDGGTKYRSQDISRLNPAAYRLGIVRLAVQQQPDTRGYALLSDGSIAVLTYERDDKVVAITSIAIAGGSVEDICYIPGVDQDDIYMIVNRGGTRYHERLADEASQRDVATCALLDAHKVLTGPVSSITGGTHLAGQTVHVWADGMRRADVTLNGSGTAALGATYQRVVYGLRYTGVFKSVKLAYAPGLGTAVGQTKMVRGAGVVLSNSCLDGIYIGRDASNLDPMPQIVNGASRQENQFFAHYDGDIFPINSDWDADARVYLSVDSAEGPCTVQGIVLDIETRDGAAPGG